MSLALYTYRSSPILFLEPFVSIVQYSVILSHASIVECAGWTFNPITSRNIYHVSCISKLKYWCQRWDIYIYWDSIGWHCHVFYRKQLCDKYMSWNHGNKTEQRLIRVESIYINIKKNGFCDIYVGYVSYVSPSLL